MFHFSNDNYNSIILATEGPRKPENHLSVLVIAGIPGELTDLFWFVSWRIHSLIVVGVLSVSEGVTVCC